MREIKFRGKRIDNGEWVYGSLVNNLWTERKDGTTIYEIIACEHDYYCWEDMEAVGNIIKVLPETVGQFTGLHDKNGVEIYGGDLVETNYGKSIIEWNSKTARWEQQLFHSSLDSERCSLMDWNKGIKVIGNIHEERSET